MGDLCNSQKISEHNFSLIIFKKHFFLKLRKKIYEYWLKKIFFNLSIFLITKEKW